MIYIGSDHAGYCLKTQVLKYFKNNELKYMDIGCFEKMQCDYPDIAKEVCLKLLKDGYESRGILICGTGVGMAIAANKFEKIRAVVGFDYYSTKYARLHNDANVICFGGRVLGTEVALQLLELFLKTNFQKGRHMVRLEKICNMTE